MFKLLLLIATLSQVQDGLCERINFENYHAYVLKPRSEEDIQVLQDLEGSSDSVIFLNGIEPVGRDVDVIVAPHKMPDFIETLTKNDIQHTLVDDNIQRILDSELISQRASASKDYDWRSYHTLNETYKWLGSLAKNYPDQITLLVGGKTYEGRDIKGVKLSYKPGNKAIFVEGGIHAREWISPATVTCILNQLLTSRDSKVRYIAENFDWYFFPNANPDGYVYTHTTNRMWRKTRSRNGNCYGADPNRNWGFHWAEAGVSHNPCADNYAGKYAFSEIETKTFSNFIRSLKNVRTYLAFHAYSQLMLYPYGHTKQYTKHHAHLKQVATAAKKALARRYGTRYTIGTTYEAIYPAAGSSVDWAYGDKQIPIAYTFELRPNQSGWNGFILPAWQIIPTCEETLDSVVALVNEAKSLGYYD